MTDQQLSDSWFVRCLRTEVYYAAEISSPQRAPTSLVRRRHRVGLAPWWTVPMAMTERGVPRLFELELREPDSPSTINLRVQEADEPDLLAAGH